ncbi:MAG: hypothetical protein Q7U07_02815 [Gammaproteobacteria bacterium]|nr:hypothetical protein [Gammaproteobacteria bacterium]
MRTWLWVGFVLLLQGCTISPSTTLLKESLPNHNFIATDSRLRVISTSEQSIFSTTGSVDPKNIICTEPSPDVATTIANSFGVGASILGQGAASLSAQQVEGLVQLGERTAAIQLLRDKMYQTCVAYANGAISGTTYSLLMSRLDDSIVTLSLGDGAAGAFGRKLASIGGEASANADASLTGLPNALSTIDDQAKKLAAANKKVDDAASDLQSHNALQPNAGKENDYRAETAKLEAALVTAKAERDALVQLMQGTAKSASEASGKISQLQAGGDLSPKPNAEILRDMQADFLVADIGREVTHVCMIELGLRGDSDTKKEMTTLTSFFERLFTADPNATSGANYAGAVLRGRDTVLTDFCKENLSSLVTKTAEQSHEYRKRRAQLSTEVATARYSADTAKASAQDRKLFIDSINLCKSEFKNDANRQNACLDQVIPIKAGE